MQRISVHPLGRWLLVCAWMGVIFFLSSQSSFPQVFTLWSEVQDVAGHLVVYGVLALLLRWALSGASVERPGLWAFGIAVLYGLSDEYHQSFVPSRYPDGFDILVDAIGAGCILLVLRIVAIARR